jgi:hypothetical protein
MKTRNEFTRVEHFSKSKTWVHWKNMKKMKEIYEKQYTGYYEPTTTGKGDSFDKWIENECGIKILFDPYGNILMDFDIIDEGKYMMYVLKYL